MGPYDKRHGYRRGRHAARCKRAGISPATVLDVIGSYCGGAYVSNYNQFGKVYRVMLQADPQYRLDENSLKNLYLRNGTEMAPVSQYATVKPVLGPETDNRFNLYSSITVNVNVAEGYSSGEAQQAIDEVVHATLPSGYGYEYGGTYSDNQESLCHIRRRISDVLSGNLLHSLYKTSYAC